MTEPGLLILILLGYLVALGVGLWISYALMKAAVLSALRQHAAAGPLDVRVIEGVITVVD